MIKGLVYPLGFHQRDVNKRLALILRGQWDKRQVQFAMWRLWEEFASGHNDRRLVPVDDPLITGREFALLEDAVGWEGEINAFVEAAIESGFLFYEVGGDEKRWLVCYGFFDCNAHLSPSYLDVHARGGLVRTVNKRVKAAEASAQEHLKLLWANESPVVKDLKATTDQQKKATTIIVAMHKLLGLPDPKAATIEECFSLALDVGVKHSEADWEAVKLWLLMNRKEPSMPKPKLLLENYAQYVVTALEAVKQQN